MKTRVFSAVFKLALTMAVVSFVLLLSVKAYYFGRSVFDEKAGVAENPLTVTVEVKKGEGVRQVAEELEAEGLIDSALTFVVQKYFYGSILLPGTYKLNSNMTGKDILDVLSGAAVDAGDDS